MYAYCELCGANMKDNPWFLIAKPDEDLVVCEKCWEEEHVGQHNEHKAS